MLRSLLTSLSPSCTPTRGAPHTPGEETAPERLGRYPLFGVIGKGSMGVVFRSFDRDRNRPVALKVIRRDLPDEDGAGNLKERLRNEAQVAAFLTHPGIVAVYEYGEQGAHAYIAMELVEGRSLRERVERKVAFGVAQAVDIVSQLLEVLQFAHAHGVCHRDIKAGNVLITSDGRVRVTDFGIAQVKSPLASPVDTVLGTPGFIAPEIYLSDSFDTRVDLFAVGALLYQLLAGSCPYSGAADEVMFKVCCETPEPPSVAGQLTSLQIFDAVTLRALARCPDDRFATAAHFRDALLEAWAEWRAGRAS